MVSNIIIIITNVYKWRNFTKTKRLYRKLSNKVLRKKNEKSDIIRLNV